MVGGYGNPCSGRVSSRMYHLGHHRIARNTGRKSSQRPFKATTSGPKEVAISEMNFTDVPTETLLAEIFSRYDYFVVSLCRLEDGEFRSEKHYRGPTNILIAECELLKDEILEVNRENIKEKRFNIPVPGGRPRP